MITLLVNAERLEHDKPNALLAPIQLDIDGSPFPDPEWIDFAVVVVWEWLAEVDNFVSTGLTAELHFMDGPFLLRLFHGVGDASPRYEAIQIIVGGEAEYGGGTFDATDLLESLRAGGRQLLAACTARGIETADTRRLAEALGRADDPDRE